MHIARFVDYFFVVGLHIMPFFCVSSSQSDAQLCSNHRACTTRQCDSLRASATSQGVLWLSQSCCVTSQNCRATSQGCSVMSQDCCKTIWDLTTRVALGAVRLSHAARACRTAPPPAPVFGVISQLCKILYCYISCNVKGLGHWEQKTR